MAQVAAKKKLVLKNERVNIIAHFREQGSVLQGTSEGMCDSIDVEISIDTEESEEDITELIRLSHQMCFTESALKGKVQLRKKHILNGLQIKFDESHST